LTGEKYKNDIEQDLREGTQAGVTGTPGFFINGSFCQDRSQRKSLHIWLMRNYRGRNKRIFYTLASSK
jgi:hypothetical protein